MLITGAQVFGTELVSSGVMLTLIDSPYNVWAARPNVKADGGFMGFSETEGWWHVESACKSTLGVVVYKNDSCGARCNERSNAKCSATEKNRLLTRKGAYQTEHGCRRYSMAETGV